MYRTNWLGRFVVALASVGTVLPLHAIAATPAAPQPLVRDVALGDGGTLTGQVVDGQGVPRPAANVTVWQNETQVVAASADASGNFSIKGLRSGVHQMAAGDSVGVYRFWSANTSPPSASKQVMLVSDQSVSRAQGCSHCGGRGCKHCRGGFGGGVARFVTNPWVLAGIVATAIAVPIALNNDDDSGS